MSFYDHMTNCNNGYSHGWSYWIKKNISDRRVYHLRYFAYIL